jgi:acyl-CoA synthetase (AMP-forming)/AMP-acid ligase II
MIQSLILVIVRWLLKLRYRWVLKGFDDIPGPHEGLLFLPNHPALIDPVIMWSILWPHFKVRALADRARIDIPFLGALISSFRTIPIPDLTKEEKGSQGLVKAAMDLVVAALKGKDNVLLYPAGRVYRSMNEDLRSNSSVQFILENFPEVRIVLVRMAGMWGSEFGWANGYAPSLFKNFNRNFLHLLANLIFFMPKRKLLIEFVTPQDFPQKGDRHLINRYLENFYNQAIRPRTHIPKFWWQGHVPQILPEVSKQQSELDLTDISPETIQAIFNKIKEMTGIKEVKLTDRLANEIGMDSLAQTELLVWIEQEFHHYVENLEAIQSVGDVALLACGQALTSIKESNVSIPEEWFSDQESSQLSLYPGNSVNEIFLQQAQKNLKKVVLTDELSGAKTNREVIQSVFMLKSFFSQLPGGRVAILMPASVTATILYISLLFSKKTPVMANWTVGAGILEQSLEEIGVQTVITSKKLLEKLQKQGLSFQSTKLQWFFLEDLPKKITLAKKLAVLIKSFFCWNELRKVEPSKHAVILFTSGSEARPKAVPLTHENIISNISDYTKIAQLLSTERFLGFLPPFHSFGLSTGVILPLCSGVRIAYHSNPNEGAILAGLIERYRLTVFLGTPTFINGILRLATAQQLKTIRTVVTGAEKCPDYVYAKVRERCPQASICEGYGITECSPAVTLNSPQKPLVGSLGKILPSMKYLIVHPETHIPVSLGEIGLLLLQGPNIFPGYLNVPHSPFITLDGQQWYVTGDLVRSDQEGNFFFAGRLKRFVKMGGEMVSLVAVEELLSQHYPPGENGPQIAIEAANAETNPELTLFSTISLEREEVNKKIRQAGLSPLHFIRQVIKLDTIPLLGTGKTNYRELRSKLDKKTNSST